jgi:hypothetical protein
MIKRAEYIADEAAVADGELVEKLHFSKMRFNKLKRADITRHGPKATRPALQVGFPPEQAQVIGLLRKRGLAGEELRVQVCLLRRLVVGSGDVLIGDCHAILAYLAVHPDCRDLAEMPTEVAAILEGNPRLKTLADIEPDEINI